jgi:3-oxoacyl-[acyl-carrier protein] reductase
MSSSIPGVFQTDRRRPTKPYTVTVVELGLKGKRAAVAAASAGLGFATARALAAEGAHVAICARSEDHLRAAADSIGDAAIPLVHDISNAHGAGEFVHDAARHLGGLDIVVTNSGGPPAGTFATTPLEQYQTALDLTLLTVVGMCHAAVPTFKQQQWGRIVAITSITVKQPIPSLILSNTARAGTTGFLKTLALEVAPHQITVNSVLPGLHDTQRLRDLHGGDTSKLAADIPAGYVGAPDDFGNVVAFLCSDHARYITGAALVVAGGADRGIF